MKKLNFLTLLLATLLAAGCNSSAPTATGSATTIDDLLPKQAQPKLRTLKIYLGAEAGTLERV